MVTGEVLEVRIQQFVARSDHEGGAQLHRPTTRLLLAVSARGRPGTGDPCTGPHHRGHPDLLGAGDLRCSAVLIQQNGKRHPLILDECLGITLPARADGGDLDTCCDEVVVSVADLTGPLAAGQSAKVAEKEDHMGALLPQVAEAMRTAFGIDQ